MKPDQFSLLLVDDNEMNRDMLSRRLRKRGYDVTAVSGGREALSLVQREDFDLVLLDIMMPDIDGIEVLKTLRKQHSLVELPVIMVTAKNHNDDVVNALSLGANDYVQKPLQFEVLLARIEIQLSRRGLEAELKHVAIHDGLTGLYNRWYFDQALEEALHTCDQQQQPLTLLLFDLDGFKQINDQLGHLKGDDVLRQVGKVFANHLRQSDMVFRYGGDEFIMLIRASNGQSSRVVKRLKQAFDDWMAAYDLEHLTLGLSMGQVCWEPGMNPDAEFLLRKADAQLYQQKRDKQVNKLQNQLSEKSKQVDVQTSFLNGVDEMIVATDLEGRVVYVNQAFAGGCGLSKDRLMDGDLTLALPAFGPVLEQARQKQFQAHKLAWSGNGRRASTILVKPSELKQERGTPYGYVFFASDITELETTSERLLQSQQFLERLNTETQLQPLLQLILEEAVDLIPNADSGSAKVLDKATDHFKFVAAVGWPLEVLSGIELPLEFDIHPNHAPRQPAIIEAGLYPQIQEDLGTDFAEQFAELGPPPQSVLSMPIYLDGELVGKFYIDCKTTRDAFNDADIALLDSLLPQIELSIRRARERQDLEKTNAHLTRTQQFLERLNNEYQLQPLLQLILEEAVSLIPNADSGSAKLYDERSGYSHFVAAVNWPMEILSTIKLPIEQDKFAIHTPDNLNIVKVNMSRFMRKAFDEETVRKLRSCGPPALSTLSMPIQVDGKLIGRFNIDNTSREGAFSDSDIELLSLVMPQIELAVRRVKGRHELEEQQSRLQLAFQLGNELAELNSVHDMAHHAADWAAQRYGYDLVGIGLIEDENVLRVYAYSGSEDAQNYIGSSMPLDKPGLVTKAIRTQKAVFVDDVTQVEDYVSVDARTRSELVVPITLRDERIGALNLESFRKRAFSQEDQELAYFLSGQLAIAISNLKREKALKLSEQRYRSLFELAPDGIMLLDEQRRFVNANPQMCALLGYSKEEFLNLKLAQIIAPDERAMSEERIQEVLQGASFEQPYVRQMLHKDGTLIPLEAKTIPILDEQGSAKHVLVMGRDVSKAQQLEQKLKESEQKYRHLIEKTQVGVCISQDDRVVFANKRLEEITGYSREELLKQHRLDIVHPDDHELFKVPFEKRLGPSKQAHYNFRLIHKKGHVVHVEVFGSLTTYQGKPAIIGTLIDMAAQKRAEKRAKKFKQELESSAIQTITMLAKTLEERDAHTAGHCQRLLDYSMMLGKKFKLSKPRIESLKYAALLHDVGKIGIPERILNKKDRLTSSEWEMVKDHVRMSVELVQGIGPLRHTSRIIAQHHEKWNGSGYPSGLKGEDILLEARILSVVDAYDAMTNDRPYREAMPQAKACRILKEGAGFQWDPVVVDIFLELLQDA